MGWTDIPTFTYDQVVDETDMNTYVKDNLDYFKSSPVISETTSTANVENANTGTWANALTLTSVAIPADIGACYVEAWALGWTQSSSGAGHINSAIQLYEASAGSLQLYQFYSWSYTRIFPTAPEMAPYYARTRDLDWAGTTRTVSIRTYASNTTLTLCAQYTGGGSVNLGGSPIVLRIVRSH